MLFYTFISIVIIIGLHELSHLIACKIVKCEVEKFSIGFGRAIFSKKIGNTIYQIAWCLIGGYCSVKGELDNKPGSNSFYNLPYYKKAIILLAGCLTNIITGCIAAFLGYKYYNLFCYWFGINSVLLGITNLIPLAPALDGGYLVYLPLFIKIWGKEKGYKIFAKSVKISFKILMAINIIFLPYAIKILMDLK